MRGDAIASLSDEVLSRHILPLLPGVSLRDAAGSCRLWLRSLHATDAEVQRRARWVWTWQVVGGGARRHLHDPAVAIGGGDWHPGGVAVASLALTADVDVAWRIVLDLPGTGDLLLGVTRAPPSRDLAQLKSVQDDAVSAGCDYMMGRGSAPPSMFYGGRSPGCCVAPGMFCSGDGTGPRLDFRPRDCVRLTKLRRPGDWVEFQMQRGGLSARDFSGRSFQWSVRVRHGEVWLPTVAWTGSTAHLRLAPPEYFDAGSGTCGGKWDAYAGDLANFLCQESLPGVLAA